MVYSFLADALVALHVLYVSFIVVGQALILLGLTLHWRWVRNPWFRIVHLLAIAIVGLEAVLGIACPLTTWEDHFRELAGQTVTNGSFVGRLLHRLIFFDGEPWIFDVGHIAFALLVIVTFLAAPPHWRRRPSQSPTASA